MSGYVAKVRAYLTKNPVTTVPLMRQATSLTDQQISSAFAYLHKVGAVTKKKIKNEGGVGRRNIFEYRYKAKNDVQRPYERKKT